jgi:hypothetical protein
MPIPGMFPGAPGAARNSDPGAEDQPDDFEIFGQRRGVKLLDHPLPSRRGATPRTIRSDGANWKIPVAIGKADTGKCP